MKKLLKNKIDFAVIISVDGANPNGDPLNNNKPRMTLEGYGEISDVCIKRKIRNRLQDFGEEIFVQSDDRCDDDYKSLKSRIMGFNEFLAEYSKKKPDANIIRKVTCEKWIDVRTFGQVFPFKGMSASTGVRGCMSIGIARSLDRINIEQMQIVKSTNSEDTPDGRKDKTTIAPKYVVNGAAYVVYGSIFPQLAAINNFTEEDAEKIHNALITMLDEDISSGRPTGTMNIQKVYWWSQPQRERIRQYPSIKVFKTLDIKPQESYPFFNVTETPLPNLACEVYTL